ncbi:YfiR family protein, partial [Bacteroidota bacterium]
MKNIISAAFLFLVIGSTIPVIAQDQNEIDDNTRATLILDISKYVEYDESFDDLKEFAITVLDDNDDFYWPLDRMAGERQFVQGKPIRVYLVPKINMIRESQVIYLNSEKGYRIKDVLKHIEGKNTLIISEGYPFKESMINFLVIDGKPRFEANEELM